MTSFDIPLTGSMSSGFTIGFMKGWQKDNVAEDLISKQNLDDEGSEGIIDKTAPPTHNTVML